MEVTLANEERCEEFRQQFLRFDFLWKKDGAAVLREFLEARGAALPDGGRDDPPLSAFEEQIQKYKSVRRSLNSLCWGFG
jgi:dynein heavy chain